ncbi:MAG: hypothetical protein JST00_42640 [Deltaproteobacteria bacterium]|nr:hypothetical protein [Deltaproteobacteria bacterium]
MTPLAANLPNEAGAWDLDWSYAYLERLYGALRQRFQLACLGDAEEVIAAGTKPVAFVRHDIDVSLHRAVSLARREKGWSVRSTYHVMIDSPFYDVKTEASRQMLAELVSLGHEVGLHYDVSARGTREVDEPSRARDIGAACDELGAVVGAPVRSVSFHLPVQELLRGPLRVAGRVSGYGEALFRWYLSDSRARWREGEPLASLDQPKDRVLQILVHPVWWGETNERPEIRLREVVKGLATERGEPYDVVRERMNDHILYRAADA